MFGNGHDIGGPSMNSGNQQWAGPPPTSQQQPNSPATIQATAQNQAPPANDGWVTVTPEQADNMAKGEMPGTWKDDNNTSNQNNSGWGDQTQNSSNNNGGWGHSAQNPASNDNDSGGKENPDPATTTTSDNNNSAGWGGNQDSNSGNSGWGCQAQNSASNETNSGGKGDSDPAETTLESNNSAGDWGSNDNQNTATDHNNSWGNHQSSGSWGNQQNSGPQGNSRGNQHTAGSNGNSSWGNQQIRALKITHGKPNRIPNRTLALMVMVPGAINRIQALKTTHGETNRTLALMVMVLGAINKIPALETIITHGVTGLSLANLGRVREVITSQIIQLRAGRIQAETILLAVQMIARTTNGARQRILHHGEICLLLKVKVEMRIMVDGIIMKAVDLEGRMVGVVIAVEAMHLEGMITVVGTTVEGTDLEEITAGVETILVIPGHRGEQRLHCLREVGEMVVLGLQEVQAGEGA